MITPGRPELTPELVAGELRARAARLNLSYAAIAEKLGTDRMWVTRRMRGETMSLGDMQRLCDLLETSPVEVLSVLASTPAGKGT